MITGSILLLANIGGEEAYPVTKGLAVAMLSVFYGSLGAIFFVIPWLGAIDERLASER